MCTVCGCAGSTHDAGGEAGAASRDRTHDHHDHAHPHAHTHEHHHDHDHHHEHDHHHHGSHSAHAHGADGALDFGAGPAGVHVAGRSQSRLIAIEQDILATNNQAAATNRARLAAHDVVAINLMSSPGSGKTTLLVETLKTLHPSAPVAVIEGDQQTSNDADRIRATGAPAVQVNTGKGCHLNADMIATALDHLPTPAGGFLFIENVGNLVCPAGFDLGETRRAVLASVTEGEDKPLKYPEMFASADVMLVSKIDLLPHLAFDVGALIANAQRVNPRLEVVEVSATGAPGLDGWIAWLEGVRLAHHAAAE